MKAPICSLLTLTRGSSVPSHSFTPGKYELGDLGLGWHVQHVLDVQKSLPNGWIWYIPITIGRKPRFYVHTFSKAVTHDHLDILLVLSDPGHCWSERVTWNLMMRLIHNLLRMAVCDTGEWGVASLNVTRHRCDELCYDKLHLRDSHVSAGQVLVDIRGHQDVDTANLELEYKDRLIASSHTHVNYLSILLPVSSSGRCWSDTYSSPDHQREHPLAESWLVW